VKKVMFMLPYESVSVQFGVNTASCSLVHHR